MLQGSDIAKVILILWFRLIKVIINQRTNRIDIELLMI